MTLIRPECEQVQEWVLNRLEDGPALAADTQAAEAHLQQCPDCRAYEAEMRALIGSLQSLPVLPVPGDLTDRVMAQVAIGKQRRSPVQRFGASIAAAIVLLALATPLGWQALQSEPGKARIRPAAGQSIATKALPVEQAPLASRPQPVVSPKVTSPSSPEAHLLAQTPTTNKPRAQAPPQGTPSSRAVEASPALQPEATAPESSLSEVGLIAAGLPGGSDFSGETESDPYYDPMQELVGF